MLIYDTIINHSVFRNQDRKCLWSFKCHALICDEIIGQQHQLFFVCMTPHPEEWLLVSTMPWCWIANQTSYCGLRAPWGVARPGIDVVVSVKIAVGRCFLSNSMSISLSFVSKKYTNKIHLFGTAVISTAICCKIYPCLSVDIRQKAKALCSNAMPLLHAQFNINALLVNFSCTSFCNTNYAPHAIIFHRSFQAGMILLQQKYN